MKSKTSRLPGYFNVYHGGRASRFAVFWRSLKSTDTVTLSDSVCQGKFSKSTKPENFHKNGLTK
jgi:hypothetical protein